MKVKDLKKLIEYWPDEGTVRNTFTDCEADESDICCEATLQQWHAMNVVKLEDCKRTVKLFRECCNDLIKQNPQNPQINILLSLIADMEKEIKKTEEILKQDKE